MVASQAGVGGRLVMVTWVERRDMKTPARPGWWDCHPGGGATMPWTVIHVIGTIVAVLAAAQCVVSCACGAHNSAQKWCT